MPEEDAGPQLPSEITIAIWDMPEKENDVVMLRTDCGKPRFLPAIVLKVFRVGFDGTLLAKFLHDGSERTFPLAEAKVLTIPPYATEFIDLRQEGLSSDQWFVIFETVAMKTRESGGAKNIRLLTRIGVSVSCIAFIQSTNARPISNRPT